jgi:AdoMet-dependent heme synthase
MAIHPHANRATRDYSSTPLNVYWEMTQACALACRHCRATAMPFAGPDELTTAEGFELLRQVAAFGDPIPNLILTGGDPLRRADLFDLIDEARRLQIAVSITPAATSALTFKILSRLQAHGVEGLGLSLDGSTPDRHDGIRGVPGTFTRTMDALGWARELRIPVQVNTLVSAETADDLPAIFEVLQQFPIARWSLFFLISVGRGKVLEPLDADAAEGWMTWIYEISKKAPFVVATTEAPSYRRVVLEQMRKEGLAASPPRTGPIPASSSTAARSFGIRDGHGIVFVGANGDICPAGFLPLAAGNVREDQLAEIYRNAPLFTALHDPSTFEDRCGVCEYRQICGGSRARAYSATGDPLASDPLCTHIPKSTVPSPQ